MRYLILILLTALLLSGCATQTTTNAWSQTASSSCSGFLNINCGNIHQDMRQPNANNILLAAALLAVGSVLLVALALGGAL